MSDLIEDLTRPVINQFSKLAETVAIICFGSYAMNTFDEHSDIDLFVICHPVIVSEATRRKTFETIPGATDIQLTGKQPGWDNQWSPQSDKFKLKSLSVDISYNTRDWFSIVVNKVKTEGAISIPELTFRPYTILGLLANAITLYDPQGFIQELTSQLYPYPARLKHKLVQENLPVLTDRLNELQECASRDIGNSAFLFHLWRACDAFVSILFAINEKYDPATKRPEQEFKKLVIAPDNFAARYERLLEGPFDRAGKQQAVGEIKTLVEELSQYRELKASMEISL